MEPTNTAAAADLAFDVARASSPTVPPDQMGDRLAYDAFERRLDQLRRTMLPLFG